jgi:phosphotransferase system enzyme I (PtsI)
MVKGIGASSGIAIGKAFVIPTWEWDFPEKIIDVSDLAMEFERLYDGIRSSKHEIEHIKQEVSDVIGSEESSIFDAHLAILDDPVFMNEIQVIMQKQYKAAEVAVKEVIEKFVGMFDLLDDEYMKDRALDIRDVGGRLLKNLLNDFEETLPPQDHPYILVTKELSPSQLAHLNVTNILGIVIMLGGATSHSAIMARAIGIPLVVGLEGKLPQPVQTGDLLIIDGEEGTLFVNPDDELVEQYTLRQRMANETRERLKTIIGLPPVTKDGRLIRLEANIGSVRELDLALKHGAMGVGLFRTEFLYMDRKSLPKEDEQYEVYRQVAEKMGDRPVIIRTLDIGADKQLDYIPLPEEDNPFLGYRAIRICLDRKDLFKTQLKAILRASHHGRVKIMYPMISSLEEVRRANKLLKEAKQELQARNVSFDQSIEVGIMIEVPAAVAIADLLAKEVDFFSIGTNDLIQYVLAVDRMNENIAQYYEPFHPAILRFLKQTVEAAQAQGIPVGVCGEMAGDAKALPVWLGLGVDELSMSAQSLLSVKQRVLLSSTEESKAIFAEAMECTTGREVARLLNE